MAVSYLIAYNGETAAKPCFLADIFGWKRVDVQTAHTVTVHLCIDRSDRDAANHCACSGVGEHFHFSCISQPILHNLN